MAERALLNARVKWAEASGRHADMLGAVKKLVLHASDQGFELSPDERNYVSFAYKNVVSEMRVIWRTLVRTELTWLEEAGAPRYNSSHSGAKTAADAAQEADAALQLYRRVVQRDADAAVAMAKAERKLAQRMGRNSVVAGGGAGGKTTAAATAASGESKAGGDRGGDGGGGDGGGGDAAAAAAAAAAAIRKKKKRKKKKIPGKQSSSSAAAGAAGKGGDGGFDDGFDGDVAGGDGGLDSDTDDEDAPLFLADPRPEAELRAAWFAEYQGGVEKKLIDVCAELEATVKETLLPATGEPQGKVFFRKMLADYARYLSEILDGSARRERAQAALMSYKLAATLADSVLRPTDPVRLGLSLNFSVFYWEILGFKDRARHVAKAAFDDAMAELDTMDDSAYRESVLILELIRENLDLWKKQDGEKLVI